MRRDQREVHAGEGLQDRKRRAARRNGLVVEEDLGVAPPIPIWNGCRPYDQVPVQLSVHREARGRRLTHHEWLADGPGDPRESIARRLIEFTDGARTILAWNAAFERRCILDLAERLPRLAAGLQGVERRLRDLLPVVRDHVYHPGFNGSFGLKSVAPALVPGGVDYADLEIAGGGEASQILYGLLLKGEGMKEADKRRLRRDLLRYCRTDTEALVGVHRALVGMT